MGKLAVPYYKTVTLKYKGWFGVCPVYYDDPYASQAPMIIERHALFIPLFALSEWLYALAFSCAAAMNPHFEPNWPLRVTGRLRRPIERRLKIEYED